MRKIIFLSPGYQTLFIIKNLLDNNFDLDIIVQISHPEYFLIEKEIKKLKKVYFVDTEEELLDLFNQLTVEVRYDYIFPKLPDHHMIHLAEANDRLGIPGISRKTVGQIKEKKIYYDIWKNLEIPIPETYQIVPNKSNLSFLTPGIKYPCIVKPSGGMSSLGIKILDNGKKLIDFFEDVDVKVHDHQETNGNKFKNFEYYSVDSDYLIQEYVTGRVVSIMGHVCDNKISLDFIYDIHTDAYPYAAETGFVYPSVLSPNSLEKISGLIDRFISYIELDDSPFMFDIIVDEDRFYFIDFAARLSAGAHLLKYTGEVNYGSKLVMKILDKIDFSVDCQKNIIKRQLPLKTGKIKFLTIGKESLADYIKYPVKDKINLPRNDIAVSNNGYVYISGNNKKECETKYKELIDSISVLYE